MSSSLGRSGKEGTASADNSDEDERVNLRICDSGSPGRDASPGRGGDDGALPAQSTPGGSWRRTLPSYSDYALPAGMLVLGLMLMVWVALQQPCDRSGLFSILSYARCRTSTLHALGADPGPGGVSSPGPDPRYLPSQRLYEELQADPERLLREPGLAAQFAAAPWLLPPATAPRVLPYAGEYRLDKLLDLQAAPAAGLPSAVALLPFDVSYGVMIQNCVYSLAKHGGARNYVVFAWTPDDLRACAALHLPCADASGLLAEPLHQQSHVARGFGSHDYNLITFLKAAVSYAALRKGHAVLVVDADVAFVAKPVWQTFEERTFNITDGAFQFGNGGQHLNTGTFMVLPTPATLGAFGKWAALASGKVNDQIGFASLRGKAYQDCSSEAECREVRAKLSAPGQEGAGPAVYRWFLSAQAVATNTDNCAMAPANASRFIDPCASYMLFVHAVCMTWQQKPPALHRQGLWFLDDSNPGQPSGCVPWKGPGTPTAPVPACRPRWWRDPDTEAPLYSCNTQGNSTGKAPPVQKPP